MRRNTAVRVGIFATALTILGAGVADAGTVGRIGKFVTSSTLDNSSIFDTGSRIGVGTVSPLDSVHVAFNDATGSVTGYAVQNLNAGASAYSGMLFYDQAGVLGLFQGFNNSTHEYRINNIASNGSINFKQGANSRFFVNGAGNLGIRNATPGTWAFDNTVNIGLDIGSSTDSGFEDNIVRVLGGIGGYATLDLAGAYPGIRMAGAANAQVWRIATSGTPGNLAFRNGSNTSAMEIGQTGNLSVTGNATVGGTFTATGAKSFTIDHPLDPTKTLSHAAIESPEVLNSYSGNVVTDASSKATVALPNYFAAINKDPRYTLTVVGTFAQAIISKKIANNQFEITTSVPNVEVSWEVKAVRNDQYMRDHPYVAEKTKVAAAQTPVDRLSSK